MNVELVNAPEDIQFFGWALEHLPEGKALSGLLVIPGALTTSDALERVRAVYARYIHVDAIRRASPWRKDALGRELTLRPVEAARYIDVVNPYSSEAISAPDTLYDADNRLPATVDDLAYQAMLASFLGAFDGDGPAIRLLATLLLRGSLNRQMTITRFVSMLTHGEYGLHESVVPTKREVTDLVRVMAGGNFNVEYRLDKIILNYANFARYSPGSR